MSHTTTDARFGDLIDTHTPVRQLGTGFVFTEGPIWHPIEKHLLFSDMPGDTRRKWQDGEVTEILTPSNKANGMTYDTEHNLLVCEHSTSSVVRFKPDGTSETLCSHFEGKELNSPNDIVVGKDGSIYFTDPTYGRMDHFGVNRPLQQGFQGVYRLPPGHRPGDEPQLVSDRYLFSQPNGLCYSPCERWMWVNDTDQANIRLFDVAPDGQLVNARVFASGIKESLREGVPDGMKADRNGNVYVTAPGGVWVYSFEGIKLGEITIPEKAANLHWGGRDWDTLYVCACTSLYSVQTKAQGRIEPFMFATPKTGGVATSATSNATSSNANSEQASVQISENGAMGKLHPQSTALILQDLQNDVMIDNGAFASTGSPQHAREQNVVANAKALAEACRRKGIIVIHVWMVCEAGHPHLKMSMSAWETSRLESYLRHAGINTIINCGAWTNMSVEHTARTGADKGFRIVVPEDACSTMNADWHRASIEYAMSNVAEITRTSEVIARIA